MTDVSTTVAPSEGARGTALWLPLAILASAQFVMVLDSSVMNVSISQIVADLDTTIQGVQLAITAYTLVMAAFMLVGAKLGDILGRDRAFAIGLAIYGARLADDRPQPEPRRPAHRLVARRGARRGARHPRDRLARRRELRGPAARARVRHHRRRRRRGGRGRAAHRRLGHDRAQLALRLRGRDGDRRRHPARPRRRMRQTPRAERAAQARRRRRRCCPRSASASSCSAS